ncbi:DUF4198 domain-containing protein [Winogradskyella sp.]|uniref:DUF4198 domain-containing protein n=1 Tax=Winogradskyella sp. TaxID=1883156 RepID=UPI00262E3EE6|nr:DUF4198 domain-containing protein [Winogradskyella sp.]
MNLIRRTITKSLKYRVFRPFYLLLAVILLCSHDLYIKMDTYFLKPNQEATLSLYNGTFENSENIIARDRMQDASILYQGNRLTVDASQWTDKDTTITQFKFTPIEAATYVAGVSTKARNIELTAEKFNNYLKHDGVLDMLEYRTDNDLLDQDAIERYEKHVKAIYQVGDVKTDDWKTVLGYPIEFVTLANPYEKYTGDKLEVQLLLDGAPLANQLVYADYIKVIHDHDHGHGHSHSHGDKKHKHDEGEHHHDEHKHEGKKHSHEHKHDDGKHSHEHDGKKHSHEHKHGDGEHSHEHEHEGKKHSHEHKHDDGEHSNEHDGKKHSHKHKHGDGAHSHTDKSKPEKDHSHTSGQQLRTNDQGIVSVNLPEDGIYYLRTIHMVSVTDSDELTHRSKWATLTFEVTHKHDDSTHTHDHDHEDGIPTWIFILGSVLIIALLFVVFRKKS